MRVIFKEAAFKHGYKESDYSAVCSSPSLRIRSRRGYRNVYEIFGRNDAGDYLHVLVRIGLIEGDKVVMVFHINKMSDADRRYYLQRVKR